MSETEILCFFIEKMRDEATLHIYPLIGFDKAYQSFVLKSGIPKAKDSVKYDDIIEKIIRLGKKKWKRGCSYNHIDMLNFFERSKKFKDYMNKQEVYDKVNKGFKKYLDDNEIDLVQGRNASYQSKLEFTPIKNKRTKRNKKDSVPETEESV